MVVCSIDTSENCFFKILAYVWLVAKYTGLSSQQGRSEAGGSIPIRMDFRTSFSKFLSIHEQASGKLGQVVTTRHLFFPTDSIHKNHGFQSRCSCKEIGSVPLLLCGSITANHASYSKFTGMVATVVRKKLFSCRTCSYIFGPRR